MGSWMCSWIEALEYYLYKYNWVTCFNGEGRHLLINSQNLPLNCPSLFIAYQVIIIFLIIDILEVQ